jgi:hypothetical protein
VNTGNIREFLYELDSNSKMMWNLTNYSSDSFNRAYASQYYGENVADSIANIYHDYYDAFWQQRKSDFPGGMDRQYIFQDLRFTRAYVRIPPKFFATYDANPLNDIIVEKVPGRSFNIVPADNNATNQVDAILNGMQSSITKFNNVSNRCDSIIKKLPANSQIFFNDNMNAYCKYMLHLSKSFYALNYAYKNQSSNSTMLNYLFTCSEEYTLAQQALYGTQHDIFQTWYSNETEIPRINGILKDLEKKALCP